MDSTLDLLNYSPRIAMNHDDDDDKTVVKNVHENTKYILNSKEETNLSSMVGTEESGFQEESDHWIPHPNSSKKSYPGPEDPFESWFTSESDMLILYELFGEFYDEEFEKLSYVEKKALKDKVAVSIPKSPEELMKMYPEENTSMLSNNSFFRPSQYNATPQEEDSISQVTEEEEEEEVDKDFAEWFEPIEELILFDLLGIDYKEHFEAMTLKEKKELRLKVDNTEPKSKEEILAMLGEEESEHDENEEVIQYNESKELETPKISPIKSNKKEKSRRLTLIVQNPEPQTKKNKKVSNTHSSCRTPLRSKESLNMPSYLRPTSASAHRERTPQSTDKLRCPRLCEGLYSNYSTKQTHARRLATGIDLSKVVSPVAQYIHSSPAPPLIRHVKPSRSKRLLSECTKENNPPSPANEAEYAPLPEASYKSSPLVTEQEMESDSKPHYKNCYSPSESVEPKIFRHLGRVKVPKSIQLNECGSENLENLLPSPSFSGSPCKMTLRKNTARESLGLLSNESMIDMSVHEVKTVRKLYDFEN